MRTTLLCAALNKNLWNWLIILRFVPEVILKTIEEAGANRVPEPGSVYMFLARQGSSDPEVHTIEINVFYY